MDLKNKNNLDNDDLISKINEWYDNANIISKETNTSGPYFEK